MSALPPSVRFRVGALRVTAGSAIEARRLTDALPAALERAWRSWPAAPAAAVPGLRSYAADRRADEVAVALVATVRDRLDGGGAR
ncbi:hypothetical protein [Streptomyces sp. I05A-00742]|uniref:hypothetical protein n=1 Tax=Streptomyces sp. I05A-00742 TaxID=2732853 RepID=UPI00148958C6|nr:hypothetical protein [Streptomyces sp. I05A-00742]